jgi:hypothetical protein
MSILQNKRRFRAGAGGRAGDWDGFPVPNLNRNPNLNLPVRSGIKIGIRKRLPQIQAEAGIGNAKGLLDLEQFLQLGVGKGF